MNIRLWQRKVLDGIVQKFPAIGLDKRAEEFIEIFENKLPPRSHVLDIGGGWGFYAPPLERLGHHVTVLDVVKPGLQKAPVIIYEGEKIPFKDKSFDASSFITVLHHVPDPLKVIREAIRVTRSKIVLIEDVYHHSLGRHWTVLRDQIYNFEFFGHPKNFKKSGEWIELFESLGCRLSFEKQIYTWLSGLRILNGVFVFDVPNEDQTN